MSINSEKLRVFVAISLDEVALARFRRLQDELRLRIVGKEEQRALRWVRPEHCHLTLQFIGEVDASLVDKLQTAVAQATTGIRRMELNINGVGCFPNTRNPRVVWAGIGGEIPALQNLQDRIARQTADFCAKKENRAYHPHLTLARIKTFDRNVARRVGQVVESHRPSDDEAAAWMVRKVVLMRSELTASGPHYTRIASFALKPRQG